MTGFWRAWMTIWCWGVIAFGAVLAATVLPPLSGPTMLLMDLVFWPVNGDPAILSREAIVSTALAGALTMGWGVLMLCLVRDPALGQSARVWRYMSLSVVSWYVIDSAASVLGGAAVNALSNTAFLIAFLIPVLASGVLGRKAATTA